MKVRTRDRQGLAGIGWDRTVIDWKWMCVEGGLCVILSFERLNKIRPRLCVDVLFLWVGVRSLCVEYAWLCAEHASAASAYASKLVRNRARPCPPTDTPPLYHAWTAHVSRSFPWCSSTVRVWTRPVSDSCIGRASNVCVILHRICSYKSTCAIFQWFVSDS